MSKLIIFTSGHSDNSSTNGGWAAILKFNNAVKEISGKMQDATANKMELIACIEALKALKKPCEAQVISHSKYLIDGMNLYVEGWQSKGWHKPKGEKVKNAEEWNQLLELSKKHDIVWMWKQRGSTPESQRVTELADQESLVVVAQVSQPVEPQKEQAVVSDTVQLTPVMQTLAPSYGNGLVIIHTDGSCLGNPGPGGWAAIIQGGGITTELTGSEANTTNNRMELLAAIEGIEAAQAPMIKLVTDSQYVIQGITTWMPNWIRNNWRTANREPVKNRDLWLRLHNALAGVSYSLEWVKGHSGHPLNERCDQLAQESARKGSSQPARIKAAQDESLLSAPHG